MNRFFCLVVLLLAGCATDPAKIRAPWYDATYDDVAARWGKPLASSKDADGSEMHLWRSEGPPSSSGSSVGMGFGIGGFGGGGVGIGVGTGVSVPVGPAPAPLVCERKMTFRDGRVVDQAWNGDPRYCETFKR